MTTKTRTFTDQVVVKSVSEDISFTDDTNIFSTIIIPENCRIVGWSCLNLSDLGGTTAISVLGWYKSNDVFFRKFEGIDHPVVDNGFSHDHYGHHNNKMVTDDDVKLFLLSTNGDFESGSIRITVEYIELLS